MKKTFILILCIVHCVLSIEVMATLPVRDGRLKKMKVYERVEPASWWAGMNNPELQLMFYGAGVGRCQVGVLSDVLKISRVERTENPNYLFVYLDTKDVPAGVYEIVLRGPLRTATVKYELKERREGSAERESFGSQDAIYLLMPDRFANGNTENDNVKGYLQGVDNTDLHHRQGGDIEGIIQHLDYIADLGMTALWTTPLLDDNDTLYSYHHYATTNFYKVDPRLGTNGDFVRLVEECHRHGLKYIMDIVPNHVNPRHWWHDDLPSSSWYNQWPEFTRTNYKIVCATDPHASKADKDQLQKGWFDVNMADLNYNNKLLFDYVLQSYIYWAELTGLDGFRVDTYPYNDLNLASQMMAGIRREYPNMNLVGECWVKSIPEMAYFQTGNNNRDGFDSQLPSIMDFILKDWLELAFVEGEAWDKGMIRFYNHFAQDFALPNPDLVMNMLDNHDMARYSNAVKDDVKLIKMGMAMLATVRGYPQYYYGDEILIDGKGGSYEDARHCFPGGWAHHEKNAFDPKQRTKEQKEVYNYLRSILQFRKISEALCYGKMTHFLPVDGVYCFFRYTDNQKVMVVVNSNEKAKKLNLERFNEMDIVGHQARNVATGRVVDLKESHKFAGKTVTILEILK